MSLPPLSPPASLAPRKLAPRPPGLPTALRPLPPPDRPGHTTWLLPDLDAASSDDDAFDLPGSPPDAPAPRGRRMPHARHLVKDYLVAHRRPEGYTVGELAQALQTVEPHLTVKQVGSACHAMANRDSGVVSIDNTLRMRRYRAAAPAEKPPFYIPQSNWSLLLEFARGRCRTFAEMSRVTGRARNTLETFATQLRAQCVTQPGGGLPRLDFSHPALREELRRIHTLLVPASTRAPAPAAPRAADAGAATFFRFLATQPVDEWFTTAELEARFDSGDRSHWALNSLRVGVGHGWVQVRKSVRCSYFRVDPAYRALIAQAAEGVPWATIFPDLPVPGRPAPAAAQPLAPAADQWLPGIGNYLDRQGIARDAPPDPQVAARFVGACGFGVALLQRHYGTQTALLLLRTLDSQPHKRAVLCMRGPYPYLEAWQDAGGIWRAAPLVRASGAGETPDNPPPWTLKTLLTRHFDTGGGHYAPAAGEREARAEPIRVVVFGD